MGARSKTDFSNYKKVNDGCLSLKLDDDNYIEVAGIKIFLSYILATGTNGGKRQVCLVLIGPKDIDIKRHNRNKYETK